MQANKNRYCMNKKERKRMIARISEASGIARYALEAKMTDEQITKATKNLEVFLLIKSANTYNRYCQAQNTAQANARLKNFIDIKNSEIYKAGQWLTNNLLKTGQDRKQSLLEKDLVHKDDYNQAVTDLRSTIAEQKQGIQQQTSEAISTINDLESTNDSLRKHLKLTQDYITEKHGLTYYQQITKYVQNKIDRGI